MLLWVNMHKDKSSIHRITATQEESSTQQVPALGATTVTNGKGKKGKNGKTHFCHAHHIYGNCKYGAKCRFKHDGTPPSSWNWPKNASEVCHKCPGKAHKWEQCSKNPATQKADATPPANAAQQSSGSGKVVGFSFAIPKSKAKLDAKVLETEKFYEQIRQKQKDLDANTTPPTKVNGGAAMFVSSTSSAEQQEFDNCFGVTEQKVNHISGMSVSISPVSYESDTPNRSLPLLPHIVCAYLMMVLSAFSAFSCICDYGGTAVSAVSTTNPFSFLKMLRSFRARLALLAVIGFFLLVLPAIKQSFSGTKAKSSIEILALC